MPAAQINVRRQSSDDPMELEVAVREGGNETRHVVTVSQEDRERLGPSRRVEDILEAAFRFLLDREPKESILRRFDIMDIARYFPDFERELPRYLSSIQRKSDDA